MTSPPDIPDRLPDPATSFPEPAVEDLERLVDRVGSAELTPPWALSELSDDEAHAHLLLLAAWVESYNATTQNPRQVIPPCWPRHPALVQDLAIQYWQYWAITAAGADIESASVWAERFLPEFQSRLDNHLHGTQEDCRADQHRESPAAEDARMGHRRRDDTLVAIAEAVATSRDRISIARDPVDSMPAPARNPVDGAAPSW